ncbi:LytTR family transcriptional regulator [Pseudoflavitalea sp. G-6-1-2]|uniref:LytR/AlgR family response regulator transcription factor n=1 Tax=Pseudoflavitalea sp. G-6-1-2 TaxID=2728841 RepID=UPI00146F91F8|nr:LytTR family DNA-binding domain-containing protein [Pseudoflavitalea sp. G-6-1-2]NML22717.1 LytTR family transcriptional regulator [Pseudoflavitalea sp. G-6-1-2]
MNATHAAMQQLNQPLSGQDQAWQEILRDSFPGNANPVYKNRFLVKKGQQLISLPVQSIRYFFLRDKLTFARMTDNKDHILGFSITDLEKLICPVTFFRVSRQFIISHESIVKVMMSTHGKLKVEVQPGFSEQIVISRERVPAFRTWLGE